MPNLLANQEIEEGSRIPAPNADDSSCLETMWFLVGRFPDQEATRHIPIHASPFQVGRRSDLSCCLSCSTVSSLHAELTDTGVALLLRDLGSTNGTFVNGNRVREVVELMPDDLVQFASIPFRVVRQSVSNNMGTVCEDVFDQAMALVHFDKLMSERAVVPHYQPIVSLADGMAIGYEVLARSPVTGLENPAAMFFAATQLNLQTKLSQMVRWKSVEQTRQLESRPHLFVNTHPAELSEPGLIQSMQAIRAQSPRQPLTLEIHESAVTDSAGMRDLRSALQELNIGLAFDDFGAGQARLAELSEVQPDYLKFDMSFIRGIHQAADEKVQLVGALVNMVRELGIVPLAEGIETTGERDTCTDLGFELAQGFLYGRPVPL